MDSGESDGHAGLQRPSFSYYEHACHAYAAFVPFSQPGGSPVGDLQTLMSDENASPISESSGLA